MTHFLHEHKNVNTHGSTKETTVNKQTTCKIQSPNE